ncbi:MAG: hypothetical protein PHY09_14190 [Desulfuromonadaceae bacterium]|nr:hypothetical protein [Desulfuromonadaceae bacterium]
MDAYSKEIQKDLLQAMSAGIPAAITDSTVVIVGANAPAVRHFGTGEKLGTLPIFLLLM